MKTAALAFVSATIMTTSFLSGCSSTVALTPASNVPFAVGELDPSFEDNGNGSMKVRVEHLGDPAKLASAATTYVIWIKPDADDAKWQNVGALKVDDDLSGEHTFQTTFPEFAVQLTAESAADALEPGGPVVLSGSVAK
jgi:hypothetical protein